MSAKYIQKFASTSAFLANAPDRTLASGKGVVSDVEYINIGGSAVAMVDASTAQTLTNKTLTSPTITNPSISGAISSDLKVLAASITYDSKPAAATITGFSWSLTASGVYVLDAVLYTTMTTVGGLTVTFKLTTATLTSIAYESYAATATDNTTGVSTQGTTTTDATAIFDSKAAAYTKVALKATFVVGTGGSIALQATQNTSGTTVDVTVIKLNSSALLRRAL